MIKQFVIATCFILFFHFLKNLASLCQFCDFSLNKSNKTYLGLMLPPVTRNWQLISPHPMLPNWSCTQFILPAVCVRGGLINIGQMELTHIHLHGIPTPKRRWLSAITQFAEYNYSAKWNIVLREVNFQYFISMKILCDK